MAPFSFEILKVHVFKLLWSVLLKHLLLVSSYSHAVWTCSKKNQVTVVKILGDFIFWTSFAEPIC